MANRRHSVPRCRTNGRTKSNPSNKLYPRLAQHLLSQRVDQQGVNVAMSRQAQAGLLRRWLTAAQDWALRKEVVGSDALGNTYLRWWDGLRRQPPSATAPSGSAWDVRQLCSPRCQHWQQRLRNLLGWRHSACCGPAQTRGCPPAHTSRDGSPVRRYEGSGEARSEKREVRWRSAYFTYTPEVSVAA
jgi:hypothetical protein